MLQALFFPIILWTLLLAGSLSAEEKISCADTTGTTSTLHYYRTHAEDYAANNMRSSPNVINVRNAFINALPPGAHILDLGAGPGRDAVEFQSRGLAVALIEPSEELAQIAEHNTGLPVRRIVAQQLADKSLYDGIWAMASLIHVPIPDLQITFRRIAQALVPGGILHASFIMGVGHPDQPEIEPLGRYFSRVTEKTLRKIIYTLPELEIIESQTGYNRDDYHGKEAPSSGFAFFNLTIKRHL